MFPLFGVCVTRGYFIFHLMQTPDPLLRWEKRRVQYKLVLLAKENIYLDILLGPKPEMVDLPLEPIFEETIVGSSAQPERERNARNAQQQMNWQNKCQRLIEFGIMCGDKPWPLADRKTVSLLSYNDQYIDHCRILENCRGRFHTTSEHHFWSSCFLDNEYIGRYIDTLTTAEFWKIVEAAFIQPRNITFDRHVFLITKQLREETVEQF